jgi:hypothetical protein
MKYDNYTKGAAAAIKAFNVPKPAGVAPRAAASTGKSHLLNPSVDADQKPVSDPPYVNQQDRAYSLAQQAMNHALKLGLDQSKKCGTCKQPQHYGKCKNRTPFIRTEMKVGEFNRSMHGSDSDTPVKYTPSTGDAGKSRSYASTNPALTAQSAAPIFANALDALVANESQHMYGALNKTATKEHRGPSVNPYEERAQLLQRPAPDNKGQSELISALFRNFDSFSDAQSFDNVTPQDDLLI